jgi:hypothetical protein
VSAARPRPEIDAFARALVRFNSRVLGATVALLAGSGLFVATLVLVVQGGPVTGPLLARLAYLLPGYSVSPGGALVGALWAALGGYVLGAVFSRLYGPWLLREAVRSAGGESAGEPGSDVTRLPAAPLSLTTGGLLALCLFLVTNFLALRYGQPSPKLALLSHYLPGFTPSFAGSLVGAFWIFLYGYAGAGIVAQIYNAIVDRRARRARSR